MGNNILQLHPEDIKRIEQFRQSKKTAVLTILFTDIVGYTSFTEEAGENLSTKFRKIHDELFTKAITRDGAGEIIKQIGDSFLAIFAEPSTAVKRALEFQKSISENKNNLTKEGYTLKVRVGIHLGQVSLENAIQPDIFGGQVNKASRIMSIAKGGQILTTREVRDNAVGWLKETNIKTKNYGKTKLKGIKESITIFETYTKEIKSKGVPYVIKKKRTIIAAVGILLLGVLGLFWSIAQDYYSRPQKVLFYITNAQKIFQYGNEFFKNSGYAERELLEIPDKKISEEIYSTTYSKLVTKFYYENIEFSSFNNSGGESVDEIELLNEFFSEPLPFHWTFNSEDQLNQDSRQLLKAIGVDKIYVAHIFHTNPSNDYFVLLDQITNESFMHSHWGLWKKDMISSFLFSSIERRFEMVKEAEYVHPHVVSIYENTIFLEMGKNSRLAKGMMFYLTRTYFLGDSVQHQRYLKETMKGIRYLKENPEFELGNLSILEEQYKKYQFFDDSSRTAVWKDCGIDVKIEEIIGTKAVCKIINKKFPWYSPAINDVARMITYN